MKHWGFFLFFWYCTHSLSAQHVVFGERKLNDTVSALHFDRNGYLYPPFFISDSTLLRYDASLFNWYSGNTGITSGLLAHYHIPAVASDPEPFTNATLDLLNDSLIAEALRNINRQLSDSMSVNYYLHGFRKLFKDNGTDVTSVTEFGLLRQEFSTYGTKKQLAIDIYWDGLYDCCFSLHRRKNKQLFELYQRASAQADWVALSFSKVLNYTRASTINVLAHSLGTRIASKAVLESKLKDKTIRVALIAPAIDGELIRNYYEQQTISPSIGWRILYNEHDFALLKKDSKLGIFGPGADRYGKTTLGCNKHNDAVQLKDWMLKQQPAVDFELIDKSALGKCHSLRYYTKDGNLKVVWDYFR